MIWRATCRPPWMAGWATWGSGCPSSSGAAAMSPMANTSGRPGTRQVRLHHQPASPRPLEAELGGDGSGRHARRPHDGPRRQEARRRRGGRPSAVRLVDAGAEHDLDAPPGQRAQRPARGQVGRTCRAAGRPPRPAMTSGIADLGPGEVAGDDLVEQLLQGAGDLDAGRAAAADHDGQLALGRRASGLGRDPLEPVEDAAAQARPRRRPTSAGRRARARPARRSRR